MAIDFPNGIKIPPKNIFPHSKDFDTGLGAERPGQATVVVALDGTGDVDTIQDGIDLLPTGGGVVYIKEGDYTIASSVTISINNVSLIGSGKSTKIQSTGNFPIITATSVSGLLIEKLQLTELSGGFALNRGILLDSVTEFFISECWIVTTNGAGITLFNTCDDYTIASCIISDVGADGLTAVGTKGIITNNIITDSNFGAIAANSLVDSIITGNKISTNNDEGIELVNSNDCVIGENYIGASTNGIKLINSDNNIISNNRCETNSSYGINISDATSSKNIIIGNQCLGNTTGAINDAGTNTHPNGASGTNNLALDDLNIIA